MELGNGWLFSIGNGAVTRPLEKGKNTVTDRNSQIRASTVTIGLLHIM